MKIGSEVIVNAPANRVWRTLAHEFHKVGEWYTGVAYSSINENAVVPQGATIGGRVCQVPGFGEITETFTNYDEAAKTFTYEATGMPFFVKKAYNTWHVREIDATHTHVSYQGEVRLMPVVGFVLAVPMKMQLNRLLGYATEELKYYLETGEVHPRKLELIAKTSKAMAAR